MTEKPKKQYRKQLFTIVGIPSAGGKEIAIKNVAMRLMKLQDMLSGQHPAGLQYIEQDRVVRIPYDVVKRYTWIILRQNSNEQK